MATVDELPAPERFWDRWGGTALNCGSAAATGVVIYLSGGTASLLIGAFAVNSALLCGTSLGKAIEHEAWQKLERQSGAVYRTWLTTETLLSLVDLCNGVKGAVGAINAWKAAGKLAKLEKAVKGQKLTRAGLLKRIREIDSTMEFDLKLKGANYVSRAKLLGVSKELLRKAQFINLNNQRARVIVDAIGNAATVAGGPGTRQSAMQTWDVWMVHYDQAARPQ